MVEDRRVKIFLVTILIALTAGVAVKSFVGFKAPPETEKGVVNSAPVSQVQELVVYVAGSVAKPGLVKLAPGARLADALLAAGQLPESDLTNLNLAEKLRDGQKIVVPKIGEVSTTVVQGAAGSQGPGQANGGKVNINTADVKGLDSLPGIGPATAEKIIAYRTEKGPFKRVEDLKDVPGIGDRKFADLVNSITVD